jgi:hypothetical protein
LSACPHHSIADLRAHHAAPGDQSLASQVASTAATLAGANRGFQALAAGAAHSQGIVARDMRLLARAALQHPDSWARASAFSK